MIHKVIACHLRQTSWWAAHAGARAESRALGQFRIEDLQGDGALMLQVLPEVDGGHRYVLEHYPAFVVLYHLDQLKVAKAIRARPAARLVVVQNGSRVTLKKL